MSAYDNMRPSFELVLNAFGIGSKKVEYDEAFTHSDKVSAISNICANISYKTSFDQHNLPHILRQAGCSEETINHTLTNVFGSSNIESSAIESSVGNMSIGETLPKVSSSRCCFKKCFKISSKNSKN